MFGPAGRAYVYFTYGMHFCVNVVCGPPGEAAAVLLRAGEVVAGIAVARDRRPGVPDRDLARGPARLTRTLGLDRTADGTFLLDPTAPAHLTPGTPVPRTAVRTGPRVGVSGAATTPWRYWLATPDGTPDPTVSPYRRHAPRRNRVSAANGDGEQS
jgi:DNA-3-methyladenine glycosylase